MYFHLNMSIALLNVLLAQHVECANPFNLVSNFFEKSE